jgi:hypothetical protein
VAHTLQALQQIKPWDAAIELLECTMVLDDSANVKTFCIQTALPSWFHYAPGQFITIEAEIDGKKHSRCYTLSSSPSRPLCAAITVKATGGPVSSWLHRHLKVGDKLRASAPSGIFSFHHHPAHKYLFLAGGVGITPLMSMAREAGLHLPSACLFGVCGTCKVKKLDGKVHMMQNGGLSDEDGAEGWVLACCSRPIGNVIIDC